MFSKRNPMKYFSGNAFARLPLYKLVAGGSAVVLTASIGLGVMAASFTPHVLSNKKSLGKAFPNF